MYILQCTCKYMFIYIYITCKLTCILMHMYVLSINCRIGLLCWNVVSLWTSYKLQCGYSLKWTTLRYRWTVRYTCVCHMTITWHFIPLACLFSLVDIKTVEDVSRQWLISTCQEHPQNIPILIHWTGTVHSCVRDISEKWLHWPSIHDMYCHDW